jgi:predicted nucleotidyltransferase
MDKIERKLTTNEIIFFNNLSAYINTPIYFYGSIRRGDYLQGYSDIDTAIFTDNESSTITTLVVFLSLHKSKVKKIIYSPALIHRHHGLIKGYKLMYKNPEKGLVVEISVYNNKYKEYVLYEHNAKIDVPIHIIFMLYIIKLLFYRLNMISAKTYKQYKRDILNVVVKNNDVFLVV